MSCAFQDLVVVQAAGRQIRADLALAAVLLDEVGVDPASFAKGVHAIVYPNQVLRWAIQGCVACVVEPRTVKGSDDGTHGGYVPTDVVVLDADDKDAFSRAVVVGATVVVIAEKDFDGTVDVFEQLIDRQIVLPQRPSDAAICRVLDIVTGQFGVAATFDGPITIRDVVLGVRADSTVLKNVARLQAICARRDAEQRKLQDKKDVEAARIASEANPYSIPLAEAAEKVVTRLRDLSGYGEAKDWGLRLAEDLRAYKSGELDWQDVDCGILLSGVPGCGKTFFANALAAECEVPLIITTYNDWQDGSAGDTMARGLKKQFAAWRKKAEDGPFILFVDEIDSIGARTENGNNETWFRTIVNAWLAFLDGAEPRTGIVVIAATNFPDRIDPALCRPSRLDRHVKLPIPTIEDLKGVLKYHLGAGAQEDDMPGAAVACRGSTPAEIAQAARDARRVARRAKRKVKASDVAKLVRAQRRKFPAELDWSTAIHEAAHGLIATVLGIDFVCVDLDESHTKIRALSMAATLDVVKDYVTGLLAGRAAEALVFGAPQAGAVSDLESATNTVAGAIAQCGLDDRILWLPSDKALDDPFVRRRVGEILIECDQRARRILAEHDAGLRAVADALVKRRYLDADEVKAIVRRHPTTSGYDNPLAEVAAALRSEKDRAEDARIEAVIAADLGGDV